MSDLHLSKGSYCSTVVNIPSVIGISTGSGTPAVPCSCLLYCSWERYCFFHRFSAVTGVSAIGGFTAVVGVPTVSGVAAC